MRRGCRVLVAAPFQAIQREPQAKHRRVQVAETLVVERARLGDVGEQLQGVADVLDGALGSAALGQRAPLRAGPPLLHDHRHDPATVGGGAAVRSQPAIGVRELHGSQCDTQGGVRPVIHSGQQAIHSGGQGAYLQSADPLDWGRDHRLGLQSAPEVFWRGSLRTDGRACGVRTR